MLENTTHRPRHRLSRRVAVGALSALAAGTIILGVATPASAGEIRAGEVIAAEIVAADASPASASAAQYDVPRAVASKPRTITVSNHKGKSVVLFAKGERIRRSLAPGSKPVTFTGLTAGRVYTVSVGGEPIGTVVALNAPTAAKGLRVSTTDRPGTVSLEWSHKATRATGGADIEYVVTATSSTAKAVSTTVTGARTAELTGLDPQALYSFSVTPRNTAGSGKATKASMTRTLAQLTGVSGKNDTTPTPVTPKPAPEPTPAPRPAPGPSTRTIWVCPDGYSDVAGVCTTSKAYTFHTETETRAYTYHSEFVQTGTNEVFTADCSGGGVYYADGPRGSGCYRWDPIGYDRSVKDAAPAGFTDNGSAWVKDVEVKDETPRGYSDNGTEWVKTTAKVERTVPA